MNDRLRRLDDQVLGRTGVALVCTMLALSLLSQAVANAVDEDWPVAAVLLVLGVLCGQAAIASWKRRSHEGT